MRASFVGYPLAAAVAAAAFLGFGLVATGAAAQESTRKAAPIPAPAPRPAPAPAAPAPRVDTSTEAAALADLAARFATRRAELDERRQALARERERLSAVDRPAGEADIALWRDRHATAERLKRDLQTLRALKGALTSKALKAVSLPKGSAGKGLAPDAGLSRTVIQVNLRKAPESPPSAVLKADTLVVRLATGGGWSLIATPSGIGFVPASQLQREP